MFKSRRSRLATLASVCALAGLGVSSAQATAQPVVTGGLVNVTVTDVVDVNNNQVEVIAQIPIGVAANVCNVAASVLASGDTAQLANCDADVDNLPTAFQRQARATALGG